MGVTCLDPGSNSVHRFREPVQNLGGAVDLLLLVFLLTHGSTLALASGGAAGLHDVQSGS